MLTRPAPLSGRALLLLTTVRRMDRPTHAPRRRGSTSILIALVAGLGLGAGGTLLGLHLAGFDLVRVEADPPATAAGRTATTTDSLGDCRELAGLPTDQVVEVGLCDLPGQGAQIVASANMNCHDGRILSWNDFGWGYRGALWRAHSRDDGQLVPPQDELDACHP